MLHSTPSTNGPEGADPPPGVLPVGLLEQLRATAPSPARPVEVARARALLASGAWFCPDVAEAIASTLLTGDDVV